MKKMTQVLGLILAGIAGMASAATIYVDTAATGANNGTSWADAYTTIQAAVDSPAFTSTSDATILVAGGVYPETVTLAADNGGASGAPNSIMAAPGDSVVIDGESVRASGIAADNLSCSFSMDLPLLKLLRATLISVRRPIVSFQTACSHQRHTGFI